MHIQRRERGIHAFSTARPERRGRRRAAQTAARPIVILRCGLVNAETPGPTLPRGEEAVGPRAHHKTQGAGGFVPPMFMTILDATIVNVALPTIGRDFGVSATAVDGISIAFLVSLAVTIPASGWLGDRYGGKRVMLAAIALFTAASALCGVASSL